MSVAEWLERSNSLQSGVARRYCQLNLLLVVPSANAWPRL